MFLVPFSVACGRSGTRSQGLLVGVNYIHDVCVGVGEKGRFKSAQCNATQRTDSSKDAQQQRARLGVAAGIDNDIA